jgi:GTPase
VSDKPQTTRHQIRGVLTPARRQIVFVDTPGIHKPRTLMGERLNDTATEALDGVDVACLLIDATAPVGPGTGSWPSACRRARCWCSTRSTANAERVLSQLAKAAEFDFSEYFPVSARTGEGVDALVEHLVDRLPEGPRWYPDDRSPTSPSPSGRRARARAAAGGHPRGAAPLDRHPGRRVGVAADPGRDPRRARVQKGIVIGKGGACSRRSARECASSCPDGAFIELHVTVDKDWQSKAAASSGSATEGTRWPGARPVGSPPRTG